MSDKETWEVHEGLKPCAYCGGNLTNIATWRFFNWNCRISCKCGAEMIACGETVETPEEEVLQAAMDKWNSPYVPICHIDCDEQGKRGGRCSGCGFNYDHWDFTYRNGHWEFRGNYCLECGRKVIKPQIEEWIEDVQGEIQSEGYERLTVDDLKNAVSGVRVSL